jgi:hypothetical protein
MITIESMYERVNEKSMPAALRALADIGEELDAQMTSDPNNPENNKLIVYFQIHLELTVARLRDPAAAAARMIGLDVDAAQEAAVAINAEGGTT